VVVDTQFPDTALICLGESRESAAARSTRRSTPTTTRTTRGATWSSRRRQGRWSRRPTCPKLQFEAAKRAELGAKPDPAAIVASQVYADTTFADVWRRELGGEIVTAEFRGPAHTGGDAVVIFEKANVVHMGDLVFNRIYPVVDRPGGASIRGWIKALEDSVAAYPADAIYIFGHGNPKFGVTGGRATSSSCATSSPPSWITWEGDRGGPRQAGGRGAREPPGVSRLPRSAAEPARAGPRGGLSTN
jgi:cyclase